VRLYATLTPERIARWHATEDARNPRWILTLRKVDHPQATDNYRVILKPEEADEVEIGSVGVNLYHVERSWAWGIDTVIPMRTLKTEGTGTDRADCVRQFKAAWAEFCADQARLTEFLEAKRRSKRGRWFAFAASSPI
jgi:hypothetical protein